MILHTSKYVYNVGPLDVRNYMFGTWSSYVRRYLGTLPNLSTSGAGGSCHLGAISRAANPRSPPEIYRSVGWNLDQSHLKLDEVQSPFRRNNEHSARNPSRWSTRESGCTYYKPQVSNTSNNQFN